MNSRIHLRLDNASPESVPRSSLDTQQRIGVSYVAVAVTSPVWPGHRRAGHRGGAGRPRPGSTTPPPSKAQNRTLLTQVRLDGLTVGTASVDLEVTRDAAGRHTVRVHRRDASLRVLAGDVVLAPSPERQR